MDNKQEQKHLVNYEIKDPRVILFDKENVKIGQVNLMEARRRAEDEELDLVQVARTNQGIPICKLLDFGKWQYQEQKRKHAQELKNKVFELKEMWISPAIDDNDLKIKTQKVQQFLAEGHKVRILLKVAKGKRDQYRLIQNKEMSYGLMNKVIDLLKEFSSIDTPIKGGAHGSLSMILKPTMKPVVKNSPAKTGATASTPESQQPEVVKENVSNLQNVQNVGRTTIKM